MDVAQVRWPSEHLRRERLQLERRPRLLLVEDGAVPPGPVDCLEDWIRVPAADVDLKARAEAILARTRRHLEVAPTLEKGVLRLGEEWVPLSPLESRLTEVLLARMGAVVSREALARAGWPDGERARNTLDVHVVRLRRRLAMVGLAIHTVRSRGYLLRVSANCQQDVHEA